MEAMSDVVTSYRDEFADFLQQMLARVLIKLGTDPLPSIATRINRFLDLLLCASSRHLLLHAFA